MLTLSNCNNPNQNIPIEANNLEIPLTNTQVNIIKITSSPETYNNSASSTLKQTQIIETQFPANNNCLLYENDWCIYPGHFVLDQPVPNYSNNKVDATYCYGSTQGGLRETHHGVEFINPYGTPVLAASNGEVVYSGMDDEKTFGPYPNFYGNLVIIEHFNLDDNPIFTLYGHLSEIKVETGQSVISGQKIGEVGVSGAAIGSHLHFEVRVGNNTYLNTENPELWLKLKPFPLSHNTMGALAITFPDSKQGIDSQPVKLEHQTIDHFVFFAETYANNTPRSAKWNEIFTMANLTPGFYRVTLYIDGDFYEFHPLIKPGSLTLATINNYK